MRTLLLAALLLASPVMVIAQPTPQEVKLQSAKEQLQAAIDRARAESKLLLVTISNSPGNAASNAAMLSNPVLRGWMRERAISHDVTNPDLISGLMGEGLSMKVGFEPIVLREGKPLPIVAPWAAVASAKKETLAASIVLACRLDWSIRNAEIEGSEAFAAQADARSLAKPADVAPMSARRAKIAGTEFDAFIPDAKQASDPLAVLATARSLVKEGKTSQAAPMYAWLWERGTEAIASFEPVKLSVMAAEMHALAATSPPVKAYFNSLRASEGLRVELQRPETLCAYLMLCRVVEDHVHNLEFLDSSLNRPDALAVVPKDTREALDRMLRLCHFGDPTRNSSDAWRPSASMLARADELSKKPDAAKHAALINYLRWQSRHEAARRYAWILPAPGDANPKPNAAKKAAAIIGKLLPMDSSPAFREALSTAAKASGKTPDDRLR